MTYEQKRKITRIAVAGALVLAVVVVIVLWFLHRTTYTDFRTHQFQRLDLKMLGVEPGKEDGLYTTATWVGEGYSCTVERNGKTGECISIPYVNWEMSDVHADTNGGHTAIQFRVAERTLVDGNICTGASPYRYSNVTLTIIFGDQTGVGDCYVQGRVFQWDRTVDVWTVEHLEIAQVSNTANLTPEDAEQEKAWDKLETLANIDGGARAVRLRLPEKQGWRNLGYHLSGKHPENRMYFGVRCGPDYVDRRGGTVQKFPQTAYFKVTYDVENTVTGERTTKSTGWISQNYTAYGLSNPNQ